VDLYIILGVRQDASTADIKRAYRRLARRYHPDINPGDRTAEEMYARISQAYETLVDPRRRQQYDATGEPSPAAAGERPSFAFTEFDFSVKAHGAHAATFSELFADVLHPTAAHQRRPEAGADLHASLSLTFDEAIRGAARQVVVTRYVTCSACAGDGMLPTVAGTCTACKGSGSVRWARGHMVFAKSCLVCGGSGRHRFDTCTACNGHGRSVRSEAVEVRVPAGIVDGARLRIAEKGHAGRFGGRTGDLYVTVHVQPHASLRREGDNLVCTVDIGVHEAVLGTRVDVPAAGETVRLRIPPGTQAGQRFRLRGRGVPNPAGGGDLVVEVRIVLPPVVDERSKELMREFGRLNPRGENRT
jgi:molecular chaperone DnaJ